MKAFLLKIILPALVAVSIKLAIQSTYKRVTVLTVVTSFVAGVGLVYLVSDYIVANIERQWQSPSIAVLAISADKIAYYLINKINMINLIDTLTKIFKK